MQKKKKRKGKAGIEIYLEGAQLETNKPKFTLEAFCFGIIKRNENDMMCYLDRL